MPAMLAAAAHGAHGRGFDRHNRYDPDFRSSLPILLNWQRRHIRYYPTTPK